MITSVTKIFRFEMAHQLVDCYSDECKNIHGHSYKLEVTFEGQVDKDTGMIIDFKQLKEIVQPIVDELDHSFLTVENYGVNPTAEHMAMGIFNEIRKKSHMIKRIRLWETDTCYVEVSY
jgi:6-pyruvoyltetrahydropterin/6-carboxytetrahydropterin synthase